MARQFLVKAAMPESSQSRELALMNYSVDQRRALLFGLTRMDVSNMRGIHMFDRCQTIGEMVNPDGYLCDSA